MNFLLLDHILRQNLQHLLHSKSQRLKNGCMLSFTIKISKCYGQSISRKRNKLQKAHCDERLIKSKRLDFGIGLYKTEVFLFYVYVLNSFTIRKHWYENFKLVIKNIEKIKQLNQFPDFVWLKGNILFIFVCILVLQRNKLHLSVISKVSFANER